MLRDIFERFKDRFPNLRQRYEALKTIENMYDMLKMLCPCFYLPFFLHVLQLYKVLLLGE